MTAYEQSERPWGQYTVLADESDHKVKRIVVAPGKRLSYQRHARRSEHWFILAGVGALTLDGELFEVSVGEAIDVPSGVDVSTGAVAARAVRAVTTVTFHAAKPLVFVEVQHGTYFGEDDIVRLEDDFGRV